MRKILGNSESPPGVENPCLIAKVLSKRTGICRDLIGFSQSVSTDFRYETGISIPGGLVGNAKIFECEKFWVINTFESQELWVIPIVRQGFKPLSHRESALKEDWN
jgi:hypothetical protein